MNTPRSLAFLALALAAAAAGADPQLPAIFGNHAVLQQGMPVPVWGWAEPGEAIRVRFAGQEQQATADARGQWRVTLAPLTASTNAQDLVVAGKATVTVTDVLVGEVWLCSGQSNMEWPVSASTNFAGEQKAATHPLIRHIKVPNAPATRPQAKGGGQWLVCAPETVGGFTAAGYFFAREVSGTLGVPVGLIGANWGGTLIEPWTPPAGYRMVPELAKEAEQIDQWDPATPAGKARYQAFMNEVKAWLPKAEVAFQAGEPIPAMPAEPVPSGGHQTATALYNGMIHPVIPFAIRGALWYQGESNAGQGPAYRHRMKALVGGWRQVWGQGDFPFYYVQLANFMRSNLDNPAGGDGYAAVREGQRLAMQTITNSGMAVIIDIGDPADIHPKNKQDVGRRLAQWALAKTYNRPGVVASGPLYKSMTVEGSTIRLAFDYAGGGLMVGEKKGLEPTREVPDGTLNRFSVAGADKVWHAAEAVIEKDTVVVQSAAVPEPVAVRYAYYTNPEGANLYNKEGLPASPFKTDTW